MSELVAQEKYISYNGKMYERIPVHLPNGKILQFDLVEVPSGPITPSESFFTGNSPVNNVQVHIPEEPVEIKNEMVEAPMEPENEIVEAPIMEPENEIVEAEPVLETESMEIPEAFSEPEPLLDTASAKGEETPILHAELILPGMAARSTFEDCDPVGVSDDDAASSTGSSSIDDTDELDSEAEKEAFKAELDTEATKAEHELVWAPLDEFDFGPKLEILDGRYLINVDGKYVFSKADIRDIEYDGKVHKLILSRKPNKMQRVEEKHVCYKPLYTTLKKLQVRSGPGSKFDKTGIVGSGQHVIVIQEGLLKCDLDLVQEWMHSHLSACVFDFRKSSQPTFEEYIKRECKSNLVKEWNDHLSSDVYDLGESSPPTFEEYIKSKYESDSVKLEDDLLKRFAKTKLGEDEAEEFLKAAKAANRKVKIMFTNEEGVEEYGWISKRKNSGPQIARIYGSAAPQIVLSGIETEKKDIYFATQCTGSPCGCGYNKAFHGTFVEDTCLFWSENKKSTPVKYWEDGEKIEKTRESQCFPPMNFYTNIAKQEIRDILGSSKTRFTLDWQSSFKSDRYAGLERQQVVCDDGKKRYRTGYFVPKKQLTITFQRPGDALAFCDADLTNTRFGNAKLQNDNTYTNLQPVSLEQCPEYRQYMKQAQHAKANVKKNIRAKLGIELLM